MPAAAPRPRSHPPSLTTHNSAGILSRRYETLRETESASGHGARPPLVRGRHIEPFDMHASWLLGVQLWIRAEQGVQLGWSKQSLALAPRTVLPSSATTRAAASASSLAPGRAVTRRTQPPSPARPTGRRRTRRCGLPASWSARARIPPMPPVTLLMVGICVRQATIARPRRRWLPDLCVHPEEPVTPAASLGGAQSPAGSGPPRPGGDR
jgi:hypothetical protein